MESVFRIELAGPVRDDGNTEIQARQQRIEQSAGPGPIGRRPELVAGLREEFVWKLYAGNVPEENASCFLRSLSI